MTKAIYPGTFDPITLGHLDVIQRSAQLFSSLDIVIGENPNKTTLFSIENRKKMIENEISSLPNVTCHFFKGMTLEYFKETDSHVIIRGLRAISDFEYEFQIALTHRKLHDKCQTIFLPPKENFIYLNSSIVKELAQHNADLSQFVSPFVASQLSKKINNV